MDSAELLAQLADIHLPPPVSFWPPAPGWWVLAFLMLSALVWLAFYMRRQIRQRRICAYALAELDAITEQFRADETGSEEAENSAKLLFINQFNAVIRRVALWHYPDSRIASLGGSAWVDFIREKGDSSGMNAQIAEALSQGRFKTRCDIDVDALYQFGKSWISSLYTNYSTAGSAAKQGT